MQNWERLRTDGSFCLLAIARNDGLSLGKGGGKKKKGTMLRFGLN